jgi:ribosomal-protein-alanine N-acetyltransferase
MFERPVSVRSAHPEDSESIRQLLRNGRRVCLRFGFEDLPQVIAREACFVAEDEAGLAGFFCATVWHDDLAYVRALALGDGRPAESVLAGLLHALETAFRLRGIRHVMHLGLEPWSVTALQAQTFVIADAIVNYERPVSPTPLLPLYDSKWALLRTPTWDELGDLLALDHRVFPWPWRFSAAELTELFMLSSRLVALEFQGLLVGYACTDVRGEQAQIIRLAVDPLYQGMGLGRHLLADALDFAGEMGARTVVLNTQWQNQASRRLYQGFGFRPVGRRIPVLIKAIAP